MATHRKPIPAHGPLLRYPDYYRKVSPMRAARCEIRRLWRQGTDWLSSLAALMTVFTRTGRHR